MRPTVLCFSGLDPSGGAGLIADVESIGHFKAHAAVACTALTEQDSQKVYGFRAVDPDYVLTQAERVLADLPVRAFKTGMLGNLSTVQAITELVRAYPHIPLIVDPVLVANSGGSLMQMASKEAVVDAMMVLIAQADLVTPNLPELLTLGRCQDPAVAAGTLLEHGARAVLIKGGHLLDSNQSTTYAPDKPKQINQKSSCIINRLVTKAGTVQTVYLKRLSGEYHGSGCTLASAIAALVAHGVSIENAVPQATLWLSQTLARAYARSSMQRVPVRT